MSQDAAPVMARARPRLTRLAADKRDVLDRTFLAATQVLSGI